MEIAMPSTVDHEEWLEKYDWWFDDSDPADVERAYELLGSLREGEGGPSPFRVTTRDGRVIVQVETDPPGTTLVLPSDASRERFCRFFERRCLDGDAESHRGFIHAINNPKS
jgi:hypothetical protein